MSNKKKNIDNLVMNKLNKEKNTQKYPDLD